MLHELALRYPTGEILSSKDAHKIRMARLQNKDSMPGLLIDRTFVSLEQILFHRGNLRRALKHAKSVR